MRKRTKGKNGKKQKKNEEKLKLKEKNDQTQI